MKKIIIPDRVKYNKECINYFFNLLNNAKNNNTKILIQKEYLITVTYVEITDGRCGGCKIEYPDINLLGILHDYEDYEFDAVIQSYYMMCKCEYKHLKYETNRDTWINGYKTEFEDEDNTPILYFKGGFSLKDNSYYIIQCEMNKNSVENITESSIAYKYNQKEFDYYYNLLKTAKEEKKNIIINSIRTLSIINFGSYEHDNKKKLWFSGYSYSWCDVCVYYYAHIWWNLVDDDNCEIDEDPIIFVKVIIEDDDIREPSFEYYIRKKDIILYC